MASLLGTGAIVGLTGGTAFSYFSTKSTYLNDVVAPPKQEVATVDDLVVERDNPILGPATRTGMTIMGGVAAAAGSAWLTWAVMKGKGLPGGVNQLAAATLLAAGIGTIIGTNASAMRYADGELRRS